MKNIIKEICIGVLIFIAVILLFAIVFYDYVPINKDVPNEKIAYTVPEDVKAELNETVSEQNTSKPQNITYYVTSSDLDQYESATVYQPGNPNPFQAYSTGNKNNVIVDGTPTSSGTSGGSSNGSIQYYYSQSSSTK